MLSVEGIQTTDNFGPPEFLGCEWNSDFCSSL